MNILFYVSCTPNPLNGGIERVSYIIARELKRRGHSCYCIYQAEVEPGYESDVYEECVNVTLTDENIKERIEEVVKNRKIDVVFNQMAYNQEGCDAFNSLKERYDFRLLTIYHNNPILSLRQLVPPHIRGIKDLAKAVITAFAPKAMQRRRNNIDSGRLLENLHYTDGYVYLSPSYCKAVAEVWGVKDDKITAIENPVVYDSFFPIEEFDKKEKIILFVGRYDEYQKRITEILRIWKEMQEEDGHEGWRLLLGGHGADEERYREIIRKEGIRDIELMGKIDPLPYYRRASIFIMTSSYEGWPMTMIESMQMGCVPIAYDSFTALCDIIEHGKSGIVVADGDRKGFITQLRRLMRDSAMRRSMAGEAVESVKKYSPETTVDKWLRLMQ